MQYNRKLMVSTAGSRKATYWPKSEIMWSDFAEKLKTPVQSPETMEQYLALYPDDEKAQREYTFLKTR